MNIPVQDLKLLQGCDDLAQSCVHGQDLLADQCSLNNGFECVKDVGQKLRGSTNGSMSNVAL